ncbi:MAG: hypothetical protein NT126_02470 [Bacteroidetes bacterium]|nr:hypothetical protein [Bacteroidota bacterium]
MSYFKLPLFVNWNSMRWIQLIFGVFFFIQGIYSHDWVPVMGGGWFCYMAFGNVSCCGAYGCDNNQFSTTKKSLPEKEPVTSFEELKGK